MSVAEKIVSFCKTLDLPPNIGEIQVMNPYTDATALSLTKEFYNKYYSDSNNRKLILGINPGRFGGGITGIPFTDPIMLQDKCGISNTLDKRHELSSRFVYTMIDALGGPKTFYEECFIGAVSPLGFTFEGKNINYYDDKALQDYLEEFILNALKEQLAICGNPPEIYSLGRGKNLKYLEQLNSRYQLFESVIPLPHPRWVMQYRLKRIDEFINEYRILQS
jgi:hypothetical protein